MGRKEDLMKAGNGRANNVTWMAIGGLIGAGAAILLAPQSGKKTRRDILHAGKVAKNKSERVILNVGRSTSRMVDSFSERLQDQVHRGKRLAEEAKNLIAIH
jgi:gas vesicle protein